MAHGPLHITPHPRLALLFLPHAHPPPPHIPIALPLPSPCRRLARQVRRDFALHLRRRSVETRGGSERVGNANARPALMRAPLNLFPTPAQLEQFRRARASERDVCMRHTSAEAAAAVRRTACCCSERRPCFNLTGRERRWRQTPDCVPGPRHLHRLVASDMPVGWCCVHE